MFDSQDHDSSRFPILLQDVRSHLGALAKELYIVCRPEPGHEDMASQTACVYGKLREILQGEHAHAGNVVQETVFFRNIQRDFDSFLAARCLLTNGSGLPGYAPASTFIQQPPLEAGHLLELSVFALVPNSAELEISSQTARSFFPSKCAFVLGGCRHLLVGNIFGSHGNSVQESFTMLSAAEDILRKEGMDFRNVVRTWIYLRHIGNDYEGFNSGRTNFFRERGIVLRPTSTGIGGVPLLERQNLSLSLYAISSPKGLAIDAISAPSLNEAWTYGSDFSRGLAIGHSNGNVLLMSGTASIDENGRTTHPGDFEAQAERMVLNVSTLLAARKTSFRDVVSAVTYLKDPQDLACLCRVFDRQGVRGFPNVLVQAAVCRPDLLCEMEVIAHQVRSKNGNRAGS